MSLVADYGSDESEGEQSQGEGAAPPAPARFEPARFEPATRRAAWAVLPTMHAPLPAACSCIDSVCALTPRAPPQHGADGGQGSVGSIAAWGGPCLACCSDFEGCPAPAKARVHAKASSAVSARGSPGSAAGDVGEGQQRSRRRGRAHAHHRACGGRGRGRHRCRRGRGGHQIVVSAAAQARRGPEPEAPQAGGCREAGTPDWYYGAARGGSTERGG